MANAYVLYSHSKLVVLFMILCHFPNSMPFMPNLCHLPTFYVISPFLCHIPKFYATIYAAVNTNKQSKQIVSINTRQGHPNLKN